MANRPARCSCKSCASCSSSRRRKPPEMTQPSGTAQPEKASTKEKHDLLVELLKEARSGFIDFMFKQSAILTLIVSWLITQAEAQKFFSSSVHLRVLTACFILFYAIGFIRWVFAWRNRSVRAFDQLNEL